MSSDYETMPLEKLTALRQELATKAAGLVQELSSIAKNDPRRPILVGEKTGVDKQLKQVNKVLKHRNREANGAVTSRPPPLMQLGPERLTMVFEPIHLYASIAMHALISSQPGMDTNDVISRAWEIAEALDDSEECTTPDDDSLTTGVE